MAQPKYLVLSPPLAVLLNLIARVTHETWEIRQAASCGLASLVGVLAKGEVPMRWATVDQGPSGKFSVGATKEADVMEVVRDSLPLVLVQMLKD